MKRRRSHLMFHNHRSRRTVVRRGLRPGAGSLDFVLILATMLPIVTFLIVKGKRIMALVWEMLSVQVSWPFL